MKSGKLWRILTSLDVYQWNDIDKYLQSPFFNQRDDVRRFFQLLRREVAGASPHKPDARQDLQETLWRQCQPGLPFDKAGFNRLSSRLLKLVEACLAYRRKQPEGADEARFLARYYYAEGEDALGHSVLNQAGKRLEKQVARGSDWLQDKYLLNREKYNVSASRSRRIGAGLQGVSADLDLWFMVEKLKLACSQVAQRNVSATTEPLEFLDHVLEKVGRDRLYEIPVLGIYYFALQMMVAENGDARYEKLRAQLTAHAAELPMDEQRPVYLMALNFCIQRLNSGEQHYLSEVYTLYKLGLESGWLFEKNELTPWTYKNIVSAGLKLQDYEGVSDFIETYRDRLPSHEKNDWYNYNLAELQLARGEYAAVLRTLRFLQFKDPLTRLRARIVQIKACYEMGLGRTGEAGGQELVEYQIASLYKQLLRKKGIAYHRENYKNFARFTQNLLLLSGKDKKAWESLRQEIENTTVLVEKRWLLEKLSEVKW